jgi:hypothetical protein
MVLTAYLRALPGVHDLFSHRRPAKRLARLDASQGASGPHDFAVRVDTARLAIPFASIASRFAFRDDAQTPLVSRRDESAVARHSVKWNRIYAYQNWMFRRTGRGTPVHRGPNCPQKLAKHKMAKAEVRLCQLQSVNPCRHPASAGGLALQPVWRGADRARRAAWRRDSDESHGIAAFAGIIAHSLLSGGIERLNRLGGSLLGQHGNRGNIALALLVHEKSDDGGKQHGSTEQQCH